MRISGKQLILRDVNERDRSALTHWLHPDQKWHSLDGPYYPKPPVEKIPGLIERWISADLPTLRSRLMVANKETDDVLGMVSCYWISEETHWLAVGITIYDSAKWGKGLGYEALGLWCDYLFTSNPDFVRLDLRTWSGNVGMMKLSEKLGFMREATFRKARIVDGIYYDGLGYGILREEWENRYAGGFARSLN